MDGGAFDSRSSDQEHARPAALRHPGRHRQPRVVAHPDAITVDGRLDENNRSGIGGGVFYFVPIMGGFNEVSAEFGYDHAAISIDRPRHRHRQERLAVPRGRARDVQPDPKLSMMWTGVVQLDNKNGKSDGAGSPAATCGSRPARARSITSPSTPGSRSKAASTWSSRRPHGADDRLRRQADRGADDSAGHGTSGIAPRAPRVRDGGVLERRDQGPGRWARRSRPTRSASRPASRWRCWW